jgi:hypothetical protein
VRKNKKSSIFDFRFSEEEADETLFWSELLIESKKARAEDLSSMMDEADRLLRIFAASGMTAKAHASSR